MSSDIINGPWLKYALSAFEKYFLRRRYEGNPEIANQAESKLEEFSRKGLRGTEIMN